MQFMSCNGLSTLILRDGGDEQPAPANSFVTVSPRFDGGLLRVRVDVDPYTKVIAKSLQLGSGVRLGSAP